MSTLILITTLYLSIFRAAVLSCNPGEYKVNGVCCPMCPAGNVVKSHCTAQLSGTTCIPCVGSTYMDHPNGLTKCLRCTVCDGGAGRMVKTQCTHTADTVCTCKPGYFCSANEDSECDMCQQHRVCKSGEHVRVAGTAKRNTLCEDCPPGHFSQDNMTANCTPWTKCFAYYAKGTSKSDAECRSKNYMSLAFASCTVIAIVFGLLFWRWNLEKTHKVVTETGNENKDLPVQETGITTI